MDQSLLTIKVIITPVLKPVIVKDKILLVLRVNVTVIFNLRLFHNFHLISYRPNVAYYRCYYYLCFKPTHCCR